MLPYSHIASRAHENPCKLCSEEVRGQTLMEGSHWMLVAARAPYASDHVMLVPYAHVLHLEDLPQEALDEFWTLARRVRTWLVAKGHEGHNILMRDEESFRKGGKSIAHLHVHFVPSCIIGPIPPNVQAGERHYCDDEEFEALLAKLRASIHELA